MVVWVVDGESVVYVGWREVVLAWALISVISHALLSSSSPCPRCAMRDVLYGVAIRTYRMLTGACNSMPCSIHVSWLGLDSRGARQFRFAASPLPRSSDRSRTARASSRPQSRPGVRQFSHYLLGGTALVFLGGVTPLAASIPRPSRKAAASVSWVHGAGSLSAEC